MKVIVTKKFKDKNTNEFYKVNQEIEVNEKRFEEIKTHVKKVDEKANK